MIEKMLIKLGCVRHTNKIKIKNFTYRFVYIKNQFYVYTKAQNHQYSTVYFCYKSKFGFSRVMVA
jgi:hypothetical protein